MTVPTGGSRPLGQDPTAAFATGTPAAVPAGRDVPPPGYPRPARAASAPTAGPTGRPTSGPTSGPAAAPAAPAVPLTSRDGDRRRRAAPLAWLPWALLAALLTLLALMLLAGTLAGAERAGSGGAAAGSSGASAGSDGDDADSADADGPGAAGPAGGTEGAVTGGGRLTAGDVDVLADEQALGRLAELQGQPAVGRGVVVESVVADEGFWVGTSPRQRTFIFLTPEARESAGESGYQVEKGQRVDLNGTVTGTSPGDAERFGVTDAEGARQLTSQRAYVRASQVRLFES